MRNHFFKLWLGGLLLFQNAFCSQEEIANSITTIDTFNSIKEQLVNGDQNTLLILDVDYTLLQPSNPAFQQGNFHLSRDFIKNFMKSIPDNTKSEFATAIATSGEGQLLEEETPKVIEAFKQKGTRVLLISGILSEGNLDWRIDTLKKLGIQPTTFEFENAYSFTELPSYHGEYPKIKAGVILTNGDLVKKHQVLETFLKKINWRPTKIIFVDDNRPIVEEMANYAKEQKIVFVGYEYKGAKKAKANPITKEDLEKEWNNLKLE